MTDAAFSQVDWDSHERSIQKYISTTDSRQKFLVKFLHRWLPVGKQVHRYNPIIYSSQCPSCDEPVEDFHHFLSCPCPERRKWQSNLRTAIRHCTARMNTNPILVDLLIDGIHHWLHQTPDPPTPFSNTYEPLITSQTHIGWDQLIFGRWSLLWQQLQQQHLQHHNIQQTPYNSGCAWTSAIITVIWTHCQDEWKHRNNALHGHDQETQRQARLDKARRRIRALYQFKHQCFPHAQTHWFYPTPETHFSRESTPHRLENWLAAYEDRIHQQVQSNQSNRQQGQRIIDDYFTRIP